MEILVELYVLGLILVLGILGWVVWRWNEMWYVAPVVARYPNLKVPPGRLGLPLLGEVLSFLWYFKVVKRPDDFINNKRHKYGDNVGAYRTHLYGKPTIIACSPSFCKFILHSSTGELMKHEWPTAKALGTNSIISLDGGPRHNLIKSCTSQFTSYSKALARITVQVQPSIIAALQSWSQMDTIKASVELKKVVLGYMGKYFAHMEPGSRIDDFVKLFLNISEGFRAQAWMFPGTAYHRAFKSREKINVILKEELEKRKLNMEDTTERTITDLMDGLMQLKDNEGNHLSDEEVLDNVVNSIHSSTIGITYSVAWAFYFLAKNTHVLQKLREENVNVTRDQNRCITYEDIVKLKYTNKVVDEILRTANISGFVFRTIAIDLEYEGYIIPKGWQVIAWVRHLHTDPENFENPLNFNPDRWETRPRYGTYFPFGGGTRACPGSTLARVNIALFLHHLSVDYKWELPNANPPITYLSHSHPTDDFEISIQEI